MRFANRDFDLRSRRTFSVDTIFIHRSESEWLFIKRCHSIDTWEEGEADTRAHRSNFLPRLSPLSMLQTHPFCLVDLWSGEGCSIRERSGSRRKY